MKNKIVLIILVVIIIIIQISNKIYTSIEDSNISYYQMKCNIGSLYNFNKELNAKYLEFRYKQLKNKGIKFYYGDREITNADEIKRSLFAIYERNRGLLRTEGGIKFIKDKKKIIGDTFGIEGYDEYKYISIPIELQKQILKDKKNYSLYSSCDVVDKLIRAKRDKKSHEIEECYYLLPTVITVTFKKNDIYKEYYDDLKKKNIKLYYKLSNNNYKEVSNVEEMSNSLNLLIDESLDLMIKDKSESEIIGNTYGLRGYESKKYISIPLNIQDKLLNNKKTAQMTDKCSVLVNLLKI